MRATHRISGFTLIEITVVIAAVFAFVAVAWICLSTVRKSAMQNYDGQQIRGIHQAMVTWAGQGQDQYPLVSSIDQGDTVPGIDSRANPTDKYKKDLPRWIMSMLIFNGSFGPNQLVGLSEVNPIFKADDPGYEYSRPTAVAFEKRKDAILDPAFACYPNEPGGDVPIPRGNGQAPAPSCSYAFQTFVGARAPLWASTFDASQAVVGNRGPWFKLGANGDWVLDPTDKRGKNGVPATASNTLLIHGSGTTWEGNVARNDNSVMFETRPDPEDIPIAYGVALSKAGIPKYDNHFANEDESGDGKSYSRVDDRITPENFDKRKNNYLRCWGGDGTGSNLTFDPATGKINSIIDFWYD